VNTQFNNEASSTIPASQERIDALYAAFNQARESSPAIGSERFCFDQWLLLVFERVVSTMDIWKSLADEQQRERIFDERTPVSLYGDLLDSQARDVKDRPAVVLSFEQTGDRGRGRDLDPGQEGKKWYSAKEAGIYVTYALHDPQTSARVLTGLSLAIGVAVVRTVGALGGDVSLKWPNDILWRDPVHGGYRKLGGILVELLTSGDRVSSLGVGIGLNLVEADIPEEIPSVSLAEVLGEELSFADVFVQLTQNVVEVAANYLDAGFSLYRSEWEQCSMMIGARIRAKVGSEAGEFLVLGVTDEGGLRVRNLVSAQEEVIHSGAVELVP